MWNSKTKNTKGISILFAVLILSVVLSIGLGLGSILVGQTKTIRQAGYSVVAFFAADAGIEEILMNYPPVDILETTLPNGASYSVFVNASTTPGCAAQNYCIKSLGGYKGTSRAIEITY